MKEIIIHLRKHWIRYGFETFAIIVGILGAFALSNWSERMQKGEKETEYLNNFSIDLERQLAIIQSQIKFEETMIQNCENMLGIIQNPPFDIEQITSIILNLARKTFVVSNPVYEDLKYSGNLSIVANSDLRNNMIQFYQSIDYAEAVFANNSTSWIDPISRKMLDMSVADYGLPKSYNLTEILTFTVDLDPFIGSERLINRRLEHEETRFTIHNNFAMRLRISRIHLSILQSLAEENAQLLAQIQKQLSAP